MPGVAGIVPVPMEASPAGVAGFAPWPNGGRAPGDPAPGIVPAIASAGRVGMAPSIPGDTGSPVVPGVPGIPVRPGAAAAPGPPGIASDPVRPLAGKPAY